MKPQRIVIIGTGQGAFQLAASLRQENFEGSILLIGDEPGLPYQRPPLSKTYLEDGNITSLQLRPAAFYQRNNIDIMTETRVLKIDRQRQQVFTDNTKYSEYIEYEHLIIATGTRNVIPRINKLHLKGIFALRTQQDAENIRQFIQSPREIIIIGGGFIGLEFAAVARLNGHNVTVIEAGKRLMSRAVSKEISAQFLAYHQAMAVKFVFNECASEIIDDGYGVAHGVKLQSGTILNANMVIIAAGVVPNSELAKAAGLTVDNGVVVDEFLQSSDPFISSLGDCASFPEPQTGRQIRLESVQAATDHAKAIAKKLVGKPIAYQAVPWFWSNQGQLKLQIVGLTSDADDYHVIFDQDKNQNRVICFKEQQFLGIETVNATKEHMQGRKLLAMSRTLNKPDFENARYDLQSLLDKPV